MYRINKNYGNKSETEYVRKDGITKTKYHEPVLIDKRVLKKKRPLIENIRLVKRMFINGVKIVFILTMLACAFRLGIHKEEAEAQIPIITTLSASFESADIPAYTDAFDHYFGSKADEARKVARCESGLNPKAHNLKTDDRGLMQINMKTWKKVFGDVDYYDPDTNVRLASIIYQRSGNWSPWKSSYSCHHLK